MLTTTMPMTARETMAVKILRGRRDSLAGVDFEAVSQAVVSGREGGEGVLLRIGGGVEEGCGEAVFDSEGVMMTRTGPVCLVEREVRCLALAGKGVSHTRQVNSAPTDDSPHSSHVSVRDTTTSASPATAGHRVSTDSPTRACYT